jgi:hypothetical protein
MPVCMANTVNAYRKINPFPVITKSRDAKRIMSNLHFKSAKHIDADNHIKALKSNHLTRHFFFEMRPNSNTRRYGAKRVLRRTIPILNYNTRTFWNEIETLHGFGIVKGT